jgi:AcrR family transcriptional regulator
VASRSPRRTQSERRAITRAALLEAAVACLVEEGYSHTTTRGIAQRAGVTPGALQHHFAGKAELLSAAIGHVWAKFAEGILADGVPDAPSIQVRTGQLLDRMWALHKGPLFQAAMELLIAARTDGALRAALARAQQEVSQWNTVGARVLFPELAEQPGFVQLIRTGQAAIRGLAVLAFVNEDEADQAWPAVREHMLTMSAEFLETSR